MTLPVLNLSSPLVGPDGRIIKPWNSFFQQFTNAPAPVMTVIVGASPFSYTAKEPGNVNVSGGAITSIALTRGNVTILLTGTLLIPVGIKDIITIVYTILPLVRFIPQF